MDGGLQSLRSIILKRLAAVGIAGIAVVCVILPYSLYYRDKTAIATHARAQAEVIRTGLLSAMMATGDPAVVRTTVDNFKKTVKFDFRMVRGEHIQKQFGMREGEEPRGEMESAVLAGTLAEHSSLDNTSFRLVFPFVADERCGNCHLGLDGKPIAPGTVLGLAEMVSDVSEWRAASIALTARIVAVMLFIMAALGAALYWLFNINVLHPVHNIANTIARMGEDGFTPAIEKPRSREIAILARQVELMFKAVEDARAASIQAIESERRKMEQIRSFALEQTDALGLTDTTEIDLIIKRLSRAVAEVEKNEMLKRVVAFVTHEKKEMILGNDVDLVRPAALYLTDLIAGKQGSLKKGSVELTLEEAITNAIVHGNLEVESKLKEEDFELFEKVALERRGIEPFGGRRVKISYDYDRNKATFRIEDEGNGFDWSHFLTREVDPNWLPHGRGIILVRTFASSVTYNDKGNCMTITFDLSQDGR